MKKFLCLIFLSCTLFADVQLKTQFYTAEGGNYVVTEQGKTYAFLYIRERSNDTIFIEEVAIPASNFNRQKISWRDWFEQEAPGHTLWTISQIDLKTGTFKETYSYTHEGWIDTSASNSFLTTLLNLNFKEVAESERRRIGFPPGYGKPDKRPLWNPRLIVGGLKVANIPFAVYKGRWPKDQSELSCKQIDIYIPYASESEKFPTFFPYLVEVDGKIGSAKLRVVDSGVGVRSPKQPFRMQSPELTQDPFWTEEKLAAIESKYYLLTFLLTF
ncbi:MAG: hypothetical protein S4CHLAM45_02490 [Chlamydiales bacterium]|nr:hypothetical protein [Chlamydiales bacterium]MCH9619108.1 hypothetical protein [Chlamydiales bacterium]MCH9622370.1 hypothetical protein [Chlamydiales bacterium]